VTPDPAALSTLRHELRTPLNHIIGYAELCLEEAGDGGPADLAARLRAIRDEARQVVGLIADLVGPAVSAAPSPTAVRDRLAGPAGRLGDAAHELRAAAEQAGASGILSDVGRIAAAAERLKAMVADQAGAPAPANAAAESGAGSGARGRILVVDDNHNNRDMLARRLSRQGYAVEQAAGGGEALEMVRSRPPDLVLLDVMMPDIDGYEVLRQLKAAPTLRDIPVLMISALDEMESVVRCIEMGAEDYLPKPFDPVLLRARIGSCLEKKRLHDQEQRHLQELDEWNRQLEQRVQEQVAQLERLGRLKRFFSPPLAEAIVAGGTEDPLRTHRREVTVVFLDLRGFTAFAETAEPEEVMGVLREYHAEMGRLVMAHEGTLERFTGDGMMIFFNDPVEVPDPAERAVRMAVAMRDSVARLEAGWRKRGYDLALGVGIAQGYATIGAIGFEGRWDYGAIGSVTNLAARLCGEAKGGQILVSARVAGAMEHAATLEDMGTVALKGFSRPVAVKSVVGLSSVG
jgi:class 3 adenylate cyclase